MFTCYFALYLFWCKSIRHNEVFPTFSNNHSYIFIYHSVDNRSIFQFVVNISLSAQIQCGSNWGVEPRATRHLLCEAHLLLPFLLCSLIFIFVFIIQMIEICFKQYIYIYNVCCFNEIHLEFAKVVFYRHWKNQSVFLH